MKKLNLVLVLEGVLLVAVIVLFVLVFTKKGSPSGSGIETITSGGEVNAIASGDIVYVNIDSLMQNYLYFQELAKELEAKGEKLDAELTNKQKKLQQDFADFQNKAQKGLETRTKLGEIQQQLAADEQALMQLSENYRMQLGEEQVVLQRKVLQAIMDYLKEYNKSKGYQYILGNSFGGVLLFANQGLDVTASVLEGINAKYTAENPGKKK
ncbi:MAG: OmpH family outer membrane protein [Bacteroidales bacterium]|jgi:outer membrane protein|nr:OmpH family outer membrane protein [Bacteroidales bacterium]